jgi:hypothetical protein
MIDHVVGVALAVTLGAAFAAWYCVGVLGLKNNKGGSDEAE